MEQAVVVKTFVGLDAHSKQCSIKAISDQGEHILQTNVVTNQKKLQQAISGLSPPVCVMVESSCLAGYVKDSLEKTVDLVIVCETRENRWISKSDDKSDHKDAERLAKLLRYGEYKEVHVPRGVGRDRREILRLYQKAQGDVSRIKNRIKAKYREHGISTVGVGDEVYSEKHRGAWLKQIKRPHIRYGLEVLYQQLDNEALSRDALLEKLVTLLKNMREYQLLQTIPGVGKVLGAVIAAIIDDPFRFASKRHLWSYAALGVSRRWSGDPSRAQVKGSKTGNRVLKYAAMSAATCALRGTNKFSRHYAKMLESGIEPGMAKRTVARNILTTALAMLKSKTAYQEGE
jgi:transposase